VTNILTKLAVGDRTQPALRARLLGIVEDASETCLH